MFLLGSGAALTGICSPSGKLDLPEKKRTSDVQESTLRAFLYEVRGTTKEMSESSEANPLRDREASLEDIRREFQSLTAADWARWTPTPSSASAELA